MSLLKKRFCEILAIMTHKFNLMPIISFLNLNIYLFKGTNFSHVIEIHVKIMILQCKNVLSFFYMSFLMWKIWSKLSIRTGLLNAFTFIFQILGLKYIFTNDWNEYLWISFGFNFRGFTLVYSHNLREIQVMQGIKRLAYKCSLLCTIIFFTLKRTDRKKLEHFYIVKS